MRIDVHQHVWTEQLRTALSQREQLPLIRSDNGLTTLHSVGEHPYVIDTASESAASRAALLDADGLDAAIIAISSPIGIEALPQREAVALIDAQLNGVAELGPRFGAWGPLPTDRPQPESVDWLRARGCLGISLCAGAIRTPERLRRLAPVLERVAELDLALFIHPGRAIGDQVAHCDLDEPLWWRALTTYIAQMQSAWLTWATFGRREHPTLQIIFAMLAGAAPLQHERLITRGGPALDLGDPHTFYDVSSYGPETIDATAKLVPGEQLLYGSDRPVIEPLKTSRDNALKTNGAALFGDAFSARGVRAKVTLGLAA